MNVVSFEYYKVKKIYKEYLQVLNKYDIMAAALWLDAQHMSEREIEIFKELQG